MRLQQVSVPNVCTRGEGRVNQYEQVVHEGPVFKNIAANVLSHILGIH